MKRLPSLTLLFVVFLASCSSEDPTGPASPAGTITVKSIPESLNSPWALFGPNDFHRTSHGDSTITGLSTGVYSLYWGEVSGWICPGTTVHTLLSNGELFFEGLYRQELALVQVPPSSVSLPVTFTMGGQGEDDLSPHQVTIDHCFLLDAAEVTNGEFREALQWAYEQGLVTADPETVNDAMDGSTAMIFDFFQSQCHISFSEGVFHTQFPDNPVLDVSWYGAVAYCDWQSLREDLPRAYNHSNWTCDSSPGSGYRLPTEVEWEFACRAGTITLFHTGDCLDSAIEANFDGRVQVTDCPEGPGREYMMDVGSFPPNAWGLHDMHGNVAEWCNDWSGTAKVIKGGARFNSAPFCRSASRLLHAPHRMGRWNGFRVARSAEAEVSGFH